MMWRRMAVAICASALLATPALAQNTWSWHKALASGRTIEIKGVNGNITAVAASGNEVEVAATKSARRSDPDDVKLQVVEQNGNVTICAVYPTPRSADHDNECLPGSKGHMSTRNNDVKVDFEVRVPRGVQFTGRTVNGGVRGSGLTGLAVAHTVNGDIRLATTGLAEANTVNGSINVRMGQSNWSDELEFSTVNGSILVELPDPLNADVSAGTVNGSISSDWPVTISGRWGPKRMHGKIGSGGRDLSLNTVNGGIELRKAQ